MRAGEFDLRPLSADTRRVVSESHARTIRYVLGEIYIKAIRLEKQAREYNKRVKESEIEWRGAARKKIKK